EFNADITKMTNVALTKATGTSGSASSTSDYTMKIGGDDKCLTLQINTNGKVTFKGNTTSSKNACKETLKLSTVKAAFGGKDLTASGANTHTIDYSASGVKLDF
ncbi:hypothetical protein, partial [Campylobacter canadensis]